MIPALLLLAAAPAAAAQNDAAVVLRPTAVVAADGTLIPNGAVLLRGDRILAVGEDVPVPASAQIVRLDGVLAPGFVDGFTSNGADSPLAERSRYLTPDLRALDAADFDADVWEDYLAAGVTAVHLVPQVSGGGGFSDDPLNVLAGRGALLRTAGDDARVLEDATAQTVGLITAGASGRGGPSSLTGAIEELDAALAEGVSGLEDSGALVVVDSAQGIRAARRAAQENGAFGLRWIAVGDPGNYGGELGGEVLGLLADTRLAGWAPRRHAVWKALGAAGVRVAFVTGAPWGSSAPSSLRQAAMAYSRATGDPAAALAAITTHAAELCGAGRSIGQIAPGAKADLVLWSAHPLDATASVQSVMIGGRTVWSAGSSEGE